MSKIVLDEVTNSNNISKINENFAKLEIALNEGVLYRSSPAGEPNSLITNVDVNGVKLYNLPKPVLASQAARLQDILDASIGGGGVLPPPPDPGTYVAPLRIVVVGDSLCAQNSLLADSWIEVLERNINALGVPCEVINLGIDAHSFHLANTTLAFGTLSTVQKAIKLAPDILICSLGFNDTIFNVSRTLAQVQTDAFTFFNTLRAALPTTKIMHIGMRPYNAVDYTPATLKNQGVIPALFKKKSTGILTGAFCSELLADAIDTSMVTLISNWKALQDTILGFGILDGMTFIEYWKISRLGGVGQDGVHPTAMGSVLQAGYVQSILLAAPFAPTLFPESTTQPASYWNDPEWLFSNMLNNGGGGVYTTNNHFLSEPLVLQYLPARVLDPETWYLPYKTQFTLQPLNVTFDPLSFFLYSGRNAKPNAVVYNSLNGAAFSATPVSTDSSGFFVEGALGQSLNFAAGSYTLRYKIGDEVYGPFTFTVGANTMPYLSARRSINQTITTGGYTIVGYNAATSDRASEYNTGTSTFTASRSGRYSIDATVLVDTPAAGTGMFLSIFKNGARTTDGATATYSSSLVVLTGGVSDQLLLNAGDTIQIQLYYIGTGSPNIIPGSAGISSKLNIAWVGV